MQKSTIKQKNATKPKHTACPIQDLLARLGDKWSVLVIVTLSKAEDDRLRFSELMRSVHGISQRMLTTTLRHLERDGIVVRTLYPEVPPRVEYTLTPLGKGLLISVKALVNWIEGRWVDIQKCRQEYDKKNPAVD